MTKRMFSLAGAVFALSLSSSSPAAHLPQEKLLQKSAQQYCAELSFESKVQYIDQQVRQGKFKEEQRYALYIPVNNLRYYAIAESKEEKLSVGMRISEDGSLYDFYAVFSDPQKKPKERTLYAAQFSGRFPLVSSCTEHPTLQSVCSQFDLAAVLNNFCIEFVERS